jgi:hypothetical protein
MQTFSPIFFTPADIFGAWFLEVPLKHDLYDHSADNFCRKYAGKARLQAITLLVLDNFLLYYTQLLSMKFLA